MKRKTGYARASEFASKAIIKRKFGIIALTNQNQIRLEHFFNSWLADNKSEVCESIYSRAYQLMLSHPDKEIYPLFLSLGAANTHSLEHCKILYGENNGTVLYENRKLDSLKNRKLEKSKYLNKFLRKKCVSNSISRSTLSNDKLLQLEMLLTAYEYSEFNDRESIVIDIVQNFDNNYATQYEIIKDTNSSTLDYFLARYNKLGVQKYNERARANQKLAYANFKNTTEYWLLKGLSEVDAQRNVQAVQNERAQKAKIALTGRISPRSVIYWEKKGYSAENAVDIVKKMQTRNLDFFVAKYGTDKGLQLFENAVQSRLTTWFNRSPLERGIINASKGRTYAQLVASHGIDIANDIISRRMKNSSVSTESKNFFKLLDESLPDTLSKNSATGYKTPEFWIKTSDNFYFVDYKIGNCIIEYNGSYWHADNRMYKENDWHSGKKQYVKEIWNYDKKRIDDIENLGYNVLSVWGIDAQTDVTTAINLCKDFINENNAELPDSDQ